MSQILNYGKTPVVPFKAKEGDISIVKTQTAAGTITGPSVASPLAKGVPVELDDEMTVKALSSGVFIGFVYNEGKWVNGEPRTAKNQAAAVSAGDLREVGIETIFKKIMTVDVSGSVSAGMYLAPDDTTAGEFEATASSGTTASNIIALTAKDSNDTVVAGFI